MKSSGADRARELFDTYTRDLSAEDLQRLFTHDTRDAYRFFSRGLDEEQIGRLPWWKQLAVRFRKVFVAFTLKLPAARRALYLGALAIALLGLIKLFRGFTVIDVPFGTPFFQIAVLIPAWADGTFALLVSLLMVNLLVLLEVADRLSLKGELEVAREIQLAMLPSGTYSVGGHRDLRHDAAGQYGRRRLLRRPAPGRRPDHPRGRGRGGQGQPCGAADGAAPRDAAHARRRAAGAGAADHPAEHADLPAQPGLAVHHDLLRGLHAGHRRPHLRQRRTEPAPHPARPTARYERLGATGIALGMFEGSTYTSVETRINPGEMLVLYSDGITEAEDPEGQPLEEAGLQAILDSHPDASPAQLGTHILKAVERYAQASRFTDDLTILILRRRALI